MNRNMICDYCEYAGRPTYDYPCSKCDTIIGSNLCMYEYKEVKTNADKIRNMNDEELARWIGGGARHSDVACNYCEHNKNKTCTGKECQDVTDTEIIMKWLQQPVEE